MSLYQTVYGRQTHCMYTYTYMYKYTYIYEYMYTYTYTFTWCPQKNSRRNQGGSGLWPGCILTYQADAPLIYLFAEPC